MQLFGSSKSTRRSWWESMCSCWAE